MKSDCHEKKEQEKKFHVIKEIKRKKVQKKTSTWKNQFSIFMKAKIPQKPIKVCGWEVFCFFFAVVVFGTNWNDGWRI